MKRRILLTGASGGLGRALMNHLAPRHEVLGLAYQNQLQGLTSLDLTQPEPIQSLSQDFKPEIIVHTVGLTDVDRCDRDLQAALDINTRTTLHVRLAAEKLGAQLIHISTNDIFDGARGLYTEQDLPQPVNMYSYTKLMAEQMLYRYPKSLILRFTFLSWFASGKTTFASWLRQSLSAGKRVSLYTDQFNSPLHISTLAQWIETLFEAQGVYHLGSERRSRYQTGFALAQALGLDTSLIDQGSAVQATAYAPRPLDVSLDCSKLRRDWGLATTFEAELQKMLAEQPA